MTDRWSYALCVAAWLGAVLPLSGFGNLWWLGLATLVTALAIKKPWLLCVCMLLATSLLSARAEANYQPITEVASYQGKATLVSDPEQFNGGLRADFQTSDGKFEGWAFGSQAAQLRNRQAGEKLTLEAKLRPFTEEPGDWHKRRGVIGRLTVQSVSDWQQPAIHYRIANSFRRTLMAGTESFTPDQRALFSGLVFGDDREQSAVLLDDFLAGGLTHLLAVSGQNVVFVLLLVRPFMLRMRSGGRWAATLLTLVLFATITRFEASVVRATTMAGVAATATLIGREASSRRYLALTVCLLVLFEPRIVRSLGFQLSVLASAGLLFLARPLEDRIKGPRLVSGVLAATIAAQLFVAPLIISTFGGIPVGSLWANVLAVPISGMLMMWGMTAGVLAGIAANMGGAGEQMASIIHIPTKLGVDWLQWVASMASRFWLGELRMVHVVALWGCLGVLLLAKQKSKSAALVGLAAVAVLAMPTLSFSGPEAMSIGKDSTLWQSDGKSVLVVGEETSNRQLLEGLRRARLKSVTLVVAKGSEARAKQHLEVLEERYGDFQTLLLADFAGNDRGAKFGLPYAVQVAKIRVTISESDMSESGETSSRKPDVRVQIVEVA